MCMLIFFPSFSTSHCYCCCYHYSDSSFRIPFFKCTGCDLFTSFVQCLFIHPCTELPSKSAHRLNWMLSVNNTFHKMLMLNMANNIFLLVGSQFQTTRGNNMRISENEKGILFTWRATCIALNFQCIQFHSLY